MYGQNFTKVAYENIRDLKNVCDKRIESEKEEYQKTLDEIVKNPYEITEDGQVINVMVSEHDDALSFKSNDGIYV